MPALNPLGFLPMNETVIPKDQAVFWLDQRGRWHNRYGLFEHPKIIDYFHACIRKDAHGFFLEQIWEGKREKVYFPYEDTAYFVFDFLEAKEEILLILNTGRRMPLDPEQLYIENDALYMKAGEDRIKFSEQCMLRLSDRLTEADDGLHFFLGKHRHRISETPPRSGSL